MNDANSSNLPAVHLDSKRRRWRFTETFADEAELARACRERSLVKTTGMSGGKCFYRCALDWEKCPFRAFYDKGTRALYTLHGHNHALKGTGEGQKYGKGQMGTAGDDQKGEEEEMDLIGGDKRRKVNC